MKICFMFLQLRLFTNHVLVTLLRCLSVINNSAFYEDYLHYVVASHVVFKTTFSYDFYEMTMECALSIQPRIFLFQSVQMCANKHGK